ncbi:hypothetical protein QAD02_018742 [Eretmocerus hayati]|uniref:Uncharacterized protein n=1 Tax=Eretmocerus hayati TaxID=131215 RepID=A0ACC2PMD8_9HYME|nr:hypothetical protein QAD02_018742 [Eretmocerus hayati]
MGTQRPNEWANSLIQRFEERLPCKAIEKRATSCSSSESEDKMKTLSVVNEEKIKKCLIEISRSRFSLVISGLTSVMKRVLETAPTNESKQLVFHVGDQYYESIVIVLETLERCLSNQPRDAAKFDETMNVKLLLRELSTFTAIPTDSPQNTHVKNLASKVLFTLSMNFYIAVYNRITAGLEEIANTTDENAIDSGVLELIQHINLDHHKLLKLLNETILRFKRMKKFAQYAVIGALEKAIWNWIDTYPEEFDRLQKHPEPALETACRELLELLFDLSSSIKRSRVVWPLQMMLLVLSPNLLRVIDSPAPTSECVLPEDSLKRLRSFLDGVKKSLVSTDKKHSDAAVFSAVKLCKASTYIDPDDSDNVLRALVMQLVGKLVSLLFGNQSFFKGKSYPEADLMIDCFVSCFRIKLSNIDDVFKVCLASSSCNLYQLTLVCSLHKIICQPRLSWWPQIDVVYSRSAELRHMFIETISKVGHNHTQSAPLRMMQSIGLKNRPDKSEEILSNKNLLFWVVRLIHADPKLFLRNEGRAGHEIQKSTLELIDGLVSLVHQTNMLDIAHQAMEALLVLHHPEQIKAWNPEAPMNTFWDVSSTMLYSISQKLIEHQISNYRDILKWLREILICRNVFLSQNRDSANVGSNLVICKQAQVKLEVVFFMYLWSIDNEAVLIAMSSFALLCEEAEIRCGSDEGAVTSLLPNYHLYIELAQASTVIATGRELQQRIMKLLRKIEDRGNGVLPAWEETYRNWSVISRQFQFSPKSKGDDGQSDSGRGTSKRRTSHQNPDQEQEDICSEWANMTGFLLALGGVCLEKESPSRPLSGISFGSESRKGSSKHHHKQDQDGVSFLTNISQDTKCNKVSEFMCNLVKLLFCNNEKCGKMVQTHVKELVGKEMSPSLYPMLFDRLKINVERFFEQQDQVTVTDVNTQFIENTVAIMMLIFDKETNDRAHSEYLSMTNVENLTLDIVRYVRHLDVNVYSIQLRARLAEMISVMIEHRDDLAFRQEMKFRNKLVEYLTDWTMGATVEANDVDQTTCTLYRELDQACMGAVAALLLGLPLQPEESDQGDQAEAKSQLFLKYFTLFRNLLNECNKVADKINNDEKERIVGCQQETEKLDTLRKTTIQAMSNLLSANIDSGLIYSIALGYDNDLQTRAAFMEVLTKILQQGTEFNTLADTVLSDRFDQLVQLVTMIGDKGELPIAMALANVVETSQMDELAHVYVKLFEEKHLLSTLLWNMFYREVEAVDSLQMLLRGNSLGSKIMAHCFKNYGAEYLSRLLEPLIVPLLDNHQINYEVDNARIDPAFDLEENRRNLIALTETFFNAIVNSAKSFPSQLRSMCHCLYQVLMNRNPLAPQSNIGAVGTVIFLRFINPAIVSPKEHGIVNRNVPTHVKRGLMLMSKILQNIANHVEFSKEQHMLHFNDFLRAKFEIARRFFIAIASDSVTSEPTNNPMPYVSDTYVLALHRLLYNHQEKIGDYLSSSRDHKAMGRRPFDKMATLLAYIGTPEHKPLDSISESYERWSSIQASGTCFEDYMARFQKHETENFKNLKSLNIFYQAGISKAGHPVFYYIARRYKLGETNGDILLYYVVLTLKSFCHAPYDVVIDLTHAGSENRFRPDYLVQWFNVLRTYNNIRMIYIYNCNSYVREYIKYLESTLGNFLKSYRTSSLVFIDSPAMLEEYIEPEYQKLPDATTSLDKDCKVFHNALKLSNSGRDCKVAIKTGPKAIIVSAVEKCKVLQHLALLNDVYYASEIEDVYLDDDNQFKLKIYSESTPLQFIHNECENIVQAIVHLRSRYQLTLPPGLTSVHPKMRPKDVPGALLNMALLNLGSSDPNLRMAAYNQLCALTVTFQLKIEGKLLNTSGLCIPSNNTIFIKHVSETLATNESHLTLEFLDECIQGFRASTIELKHLCLEYMTPWLKNLVLFYKPDQAINPDDEKHWKQLKQILEKLITLTIEEVQMYPSIQAKIWGTIGQLPDLIDLVLDNFIEFSIQHGLGSPGVEIMADTAVALASGNVKLVAKFIITRLCKTIDNTSSSPTASLEQHMLWNNIAILARYLLMLSFNNCLDVGTYLPDLFHLVTFLMSLGNLSMRASTHGLVVNIIHSLCTCKTPPFTDETLKVLKLSLEEFCLPQFYEKFGIKAVKSVAVTAFRSCGLHSTEKCHGTELGIAQDRVKLTLANLEIVTDALLEIMVACMKDIKECNWLERWTLLAQRIALSNNTALQPRALIVFGCISKSVTDNEFKQLLRILVKALERYNDLALIEAIIMCLTRLQPLLRKKSPIHRHLFWISVCVLQLDDAFLYAAGLALLEQNLHTLSSQRIFDDRTLEDVMMMTREPLEYHFKQLDQAVGLSFKSNFHFALVGHLLKGFRHPEPTTVNMTSRVLTALLSIIAKPHKRDKFEVTLESAAYLAALVSVSEEVRSRCLIRHSLSRGTGDYGSSDLLDSIDLQSSNGPANSNHPLNRRQKSLDLLDQTALSLERRLKLLPAHYHQSGRIVFKPQRSFSMASTKEIKADSELDTKNRSTRISVGSENNVLLDPDVLTDFMTQALVSTVLATLLKYSNNEDQTRILYEYLAEASVVFPSVFPIVNSLLDANLTSAIAECHDQKILSSVQAIIQNMISNENINQQQLSYLQSCGFGGPWRFAGPFMNTNSSSDGPELFVNCLKEIIDTCFAAEEVEGTSCNGLPVNESGSDSSKTSSLHAVGSCKLSKGSGSSPSLGRKDQSIGKSSHRSDTSLTNLNNNSEEHNNSAQLVEKQKDRSEIKNHMDPNQSSGNLQR